MTKHEPLTSLYELPEDDGLGAAYWIAFLPILATIVLGVGVYVSIGTWK